MVVGSWDGRMCTMLCWLLYVFNHFGCNRIFIDSFRKKLNFLTVFPKTSVFDGGRLFRKLCILLFSFFFCSCLQNIWIGISGPTLYMSEQGARYQWWELLESSPQCDGYLLLWAELATVGLDDRGRNEPSHQAKSYFFLHHCKAGVIWAILDFPRQK